MEGVDKTKTEADSLKLTSILSLTVSHCTGVPNLEADLHV